MVAQLWMWWLRYLVGDVVAQLLDKMWHSCTNRLSLMNSQPVKHWDNIRQNDEALGTNSTELVYC